MISEKQQLIYNIYLKFSRKGKPYKFRKNFDTISDDIIYFLTKLESFFDCFKNIKYDDFFEAPYKIIDDNGYYDLKFYLTQKAKKCYTLYMQNKRISQSITKESILKNLQFISSFCKKNNIHINDYLNYKLNENSFPEFIKHLKDNDIDMYILFGFDNFENILYGINNIEYVITDYERLVSQTRILFVSSAYKNFIKNVIKKLIQQWQ